MTFQELYSLRYIEQEIADYKKKIIELRELAESMTPKLTGMPRGDGCGDKVGNAATEIVLYTEMLETAIKRDVEQSRKINEYIAQIDDVQLRRIMYLRFIEHKTWLQVANAIGGNNTEDSVRKRANRYVRKHQKMSDLSAKIVV